ncbi:MAG: (d)CMP kinase [Gemmatimonadetes bacterium]|nr:(d)CMP kinase [Gemmatimonadota bacterium]
MTGITIAIDGPAASGKSTTAARVARALGYNHLNSGLLYRGITWAALEGAWPSDASGFERELSELSVGLDRIGAGYRVLVNGTDPGVNLVSPSTSSRVSDVSARPAVRDRVLELLRAEGGRGGVVCDGRDIGTVVFPEAELKVFLVASVEERGRRRLLDHGMDPTEKAVRLEAERLEARDSADSSRSVAPLRAAADAIRLDTTDLSAGQVVEQIVALARERGARLG